MTSLETRPIAKTVQLDVADNGVNNAVPAANARRLRGSYLISSEDRYCRNCGTRETTLWRRSKMESQLLCNACGTYERLHDSPRPYGICQRTTHRTRRRARRVSGTNKSVKNNITTQASAQAQSSSKQKINNSDEQCSSMASPAQTPIANSMRGRLLQRPAEGLVGRFAPMGPLSSPLISAQGQYHNFRPAMNGYPRADATELIPIAAMQPHSYASQCDSRAQDLYTRDYDAVVASRSVSDVPYHQYMRCRCRECHPEHGVAYYSCESQDWGDEAQRPVSVPSDMYTGRYGKCTGWREDEANAQYVNGQNRWESGHWEPARRSSYGYYVDPAHEPRGPIYNSNCEPPPPYESGRLDNYSSHAVRQARDFDGQGAYSGAVGGVQYHTATAISHQSPIPS